MAFPTTLSGSGTTSWPPTTSGNLGPFVYGGNVYVIVREMIAKPFYIAVAKATDPSSSFTYMDTANAPSVSFNACDAILSGSIIHVAVTNATGTITYYAKFDCSTDTWQQVDGASTRKTVYTCSPAAEVPWCSITARSDDDIIILHPGDGTASMGSAVDCVYYSRLEGSTWTAGVSVADTNTKDQDYQYGYAVMGGSDQCHFAYTRADTADFYLRALNSSNTLRTERTLAAAISNVNKGVKYTRASVNKIAFYVTVSSNGYRYYWTDFSDDTNPTITVETCMPGAANLYAPIKNSGYAVDTNDADQENYIGAPTSTTFDMFLQSDAGGTTWSALNGGAAIRAGTVEGSSGNIYSRGGNRVYGFLYDDAGTVKFDEFTLYALSSPSFIFNHQPLQHLLVR